jgi:hypothetical protein
MLTGICHECQKVYYGWALESPKWKRCPRCGGQLNIFDSTANGGRNLPSFSIGAPVESVPRQIKERLFK